MKVTMNETMKVPWLPRYVKDRWKRTEDITNIIAMFKSGNEEKSELLLETEN